MNITMNPALERFVEQEARRRGFDSAGDYIAEVLDKEWRGQLARHLGLTSTRGLAEELRLGAEERFEEDKHLAEEWFGVEEEAHERGTP